MKAERRSADGKLLAYGCSDLSIGMLDAATLNVSCPMFRLCDSAEEYSHY